MILEKCKKFNKNIMKKSLLIFASLLIVLSSYSQDSTNTKKEKEIALSFSNLNSFGLSYRFGKPNSLWRINTLIISGSNSNKKGDGLDEGRIRSGLTVKFGKEFRKSITDKVEIRYGADLSVGIAKNKSDIDDKSTANNDRSYERRTYSPGINLIFGFNYLINDNLLIGAEILPDFTYTTGTETDITNGIEETFDISEYSYGLSNNSVLLTVAYRF